MTFRTTYDSALVHFDRLTAWAEIYRGWTAFFSGVIASAVMLGSLYVLATIDDAKVRHGVYGLASSAPYGYSVSDTAKSISGKISPGIQKFASGQKDEFVGRMGGALSPARLAAKVVYDPLVREVPVGVEILTDQVITHLGTYSVSDLLKSLAEHAKAKGTELHPSLSRAFAAENR